METSTVCSALMPSSDGHELYHVVRMCQGIVKAFLEKRYVGALITCVGRLFQGCGTWRDETFYRQLSRPYCVAYLN